MSAREPINLHALRAWAEREAAHPESATHPTTVLALIDAVEAARELPIGYYETFAAYCHDAPARRRLRKALARFDHNPST